MMFVSCITCSLSAASHRGYRTTFRHRYSGQQAKGLLVLPAVQVPDNTATVGNASCGPIGGLAPLIFLVLGKPLPLLCPLEVSCLRKIGDVSWIQSLFYSRWVLASLPDTASASGSLVSAA